MSRSGTLADLARRIRRCRGCRLHQGRTRAVPGEGPAGAAVMLVGEAPGAEEDASGRPFVGRSGRLLDELLAAAGIDRATVFVTSCIKCRPPGNRTPRRDELDTCTRRWLAAQIEAIDPAIVVLLGRTAIGELLGERGGLKELHGQVRRREGRDYLLTYHPAAALRFPRLKEMIKEDFAKLAGLIRAPGADSG